LPHILNRIYAISEKYDIKTVNVFHAGDGNIHPIVLFDERDKEQTQRALRVSEEILEECIACGGSVTGEHGIGVEKTNLMPKLFSPDDLAAMRRLRDAFNPTNCLSPDKMLPTAAGCGLEMKHPGRRAAL
jgi:glycolate oxidase